MTDPIRVLALGAGVQSSTLLLMACLGEHEPPDRAIFADTGWEPQAVYTWLGDVLEPAAAEAGIPVDRVSAGNIRDDALNPLHRFASMPLFVKPPPKTERFQGVDVPLLKSTGEKGGMVRRQCTKEYKISPIRRRIRELLAKGQTAEQWFGITLDEIERMREPDVRYISFRYPLVDLRMTRWDCQRWLEAAGFPEAPKSACIGCPFHNNDQWRSLPADEFADAVDFDEAIRGGNAGQGIGQIRGTAYLHRSMVPLSQADLTTPEDHGQMSLFGNECEGMCGV